MLDYDTWPSKTKECCNAFLKTLDKRRRAIMQERCGLLSCKTTRKALAERYNVSIPRIRELELETIKAFEAYQKGDWIPQGKSQHPWWETRFWTTEDIRSFCRFIEELAPKESDIAKSRSGLFGPMKSLDELAKEHKATKERIRAIYTRIRINFKLTRRKEIATEVAPNI